jgi:hypothetical protein
MGIYHEQSLFAFYARKERKMSIGVSLAYWICTKNSSRIPETPWTVEAEGNWWFQIHNYEYAEDVKRKICYKH